MKHPIPTHDSAQVMQWLEAVKDPEIPVLSVVDLGIVRAIGWEGNTCVVTITPTYSGCPAMHDITQSIHHTLGLHGIASVRVDVSLHEAWTTDWMSDKGKRALQSYGIAPPREQAIDIASITRRTDPDVPCPLCGSSDTRLLSHFGSTACKALYRCRQCGEPFDYFKAH